MSKLYDASLVLTFPSDDMDDADATLDRLLESLEQEGFETSTAILEESISAE